MTSSWLLQKLQLGLKPYLDSIINRFSVPILSICWLLITLPHLKAIIMKHQFFLLGLFSFLLHSCKKNDAGDPSAEGTKLAKAVSTDGQYTQTTFYTYDADGKLAGLRETETGGGMNSESGFRIVRKAGGMIERVVFKNSGSSDSTTLFVTSSGQQYISTERTESAGPGTLTTKVTFVYNSAGAITEATEVDTYSGSSPDPQSRTTYAYSNNNLTAIKLYRISGGTNNLADQYDMEYDSKTNPLASGNEWLVLSTATGAAEWLGSTNNFTKLIYQDAGQPTETYNIAYTYTSKGLPLTANIKSSDPSQPAQKITYTYQ
jgi:hypothetical protein